MSVSNHSTRSVEELLSDLNLLNEGLKGEISKLREYSSGSGFSFVILGDILRNLENFPMSSELLKRTLIGKSVSKAELRLKDIAASVTEGQELMQLCGDLVKRWKNLYTSSVNKSPIAPLTGSANAKVGGVGGPSVKLPVRGSSHGSIAPFSTSATATAAVASVKSVKSNIDTVTITYGDMAENHVGMQKIGTLAEKGYSLNDITHAKTYFESIGGECTLMDLRDAVKDNSIRAHLEPAYVLIIRNGVDSLLRDVDQTHVDMYKEQSGLDYDKKVFMYGQVRNKHARYNLCFSEEDQEPDYENKKGRIVSFAKVPLTNYIRTKIPTIFSASSSLASSSHSSGGGGGGATSAAAPSGGGGVEGSGSVDKSNELQAEGNYYFDASKCGIGFHGDAERLKVVAVRLGRVTIPMHWQWYHRNEPVGERIKVNDLSSGAMYIMSEKATGFDWKKSSLYTLRHAAGADKFLK